MTSPAQARAILGVGADASADEIRRAYRRLARTAHPDAGGDAAAFHELQQAVAVLLSPGPRVEPPTSSPSTSRHTRPSTTTRMGASGWGESAGPQWYEEVVDTTRVAWERPLPDPPHPWERDLVAVAARPALDDDVPVRAVTGVSRRPGSRLNRFAGWLSGDLLARWELGPARTRGNPGHDVEVRIELAGTRARRLADDAAWPLGWTRERRPAISVVTSVLTPSRDPEATATRAADRLVDGLDLLGWPLGDWYRVPDA